MIILCFYTGPVTTKSQLSSPSRGASVGKNKAQRVSRIERINRRRRRNLFELKSHEEWVDDGLYAWTSQIIAGYGSWVVDACPHRRVRRREGTASKWERTERADLYCCSCTRRYAINSKIRTSETC